MPIEGRIAALCLTYGYLPQQVLDMELRWLDILEYTNYLSKQSWQPIQQS